MTKTGYTTKGRTMNGLQIDMHAQIRATRLTNMKCAEKCSGSTDEGDEETEVGGRGTECERWS
jgi:hypothetical protein